MEKIQKISLDFAFRISLTIKITGNFKHSYNREKTVVTFLCV